MKPGTNDEKTRIRWGALAVACSLGGIALASCGGGPQRNLPPPQYERPELPPWDAPEKASGDAFDPAALEGEWVTDEPAETPGAEGQGDARGQGGAGGAPQTAGSS